LADAAACEAKRSVASMASTMAAAEVRRVRSMSVIIDRIRVDLLPRGGILTTS
jgi:hypothetical protein